MNLTQQLTKACEDLNKQGHFNELPVIIAKAQCEKQKREDAKSDEMTEEETRAYIEDYCCVEFGLDVYYALDDAPSQYTNVSFDYASLEADFREWLKKYVPEETIPESLFLEQGDNEFMKPGYGE